MCNGRTVDKDNTDRVHGTCYKKHPEGQRCSAEIICQTWPSSTGQFCLLNPGTFLLPKVLSLLPATDIMPVCSFPAQQPVPNLPNSPFVQPILLQPPKTNAVDMFPFALHLLACPRSAGSCSISLMCPWAR